MMSPRARLGMHSFAGGAHLNFVRQKGPRNAGASLSFLNRLTRPERGCAAVRSKPSDLLIQLRKTPWMLSKDCTDFREQFVAHVFVHDLFGGGAECIPNIVRELQRFDALLLQTGQVRHRCWTVFLPTASALWRMHAFAGWPDAVVSGRSKRRG